MNHTSAEASHYDNGASSYDLFNESKSEEINRLIEQILRRYKVKSVLDMTCGTGSQIFWLQKHGFEVVGLDINKKMLQVARKKSKEQSLDIRFIEGDVRTSQVGEFGAVLTIFNAVGHLTKSDFEKAMRNVRKNLKPGGIYIFDIFNLSCLLHETNITKLTIDWFKYIGSKIERVVQFSTITPKGVLGSETIFIEQSGNRTKRRVSTQTLQVYTPKQLQEMLEKNGFQVLKQTAADGSKLIETKTERILAIAQNKS